MLRLTEIPMKIEIKQEQPGTYCCPLINQKEIKKPKGINPKQVRNIWCNKDLFFELRTGRNQIWVIYPCFHSNLSHNP